MFERDCGKDCDHDKRAGSLPVAHKTAQDFPVPFARIAREEAREFLLQTLADGPKTVLEVFADAERLRISRATLRRAKGDLGVVADKTLNHWSGAYPRVRNPTGPAA
jgi:hypothetical protein